MSFITRIWHHSVTLRETISWQSVQETHTMSKLTIKLKLSYKFISPAVSFSIWMCLQWPCCGAAKVIFKFVCISLFFAHLTRRKYFWYKSSLKRTVSPNIIFFFKSLTHHRHIIIEPLKIGPRRLDEFHSENHQHKSEDDAEDAQDGHEASIRRHVTFFCLLWEKDQKERPQN